MQILAHGLNHRTAPLELREKVAFVPEEAAEGMRRLAEQEAISEIAILSTCNRTEFYAVVEDAEDAVARQRELVRAFKDVDLSPGNSTYVLRQRECVEHLFRVAGGIDSMVIGEAAILGQVKSAFEAALEQETVGPVLGRLFPHALRVGKRSRSETSIGEGAVSIEKCGVQLARKIFGDLPRRSALVIGAGDTGQRIAGLLRDAGMGDLAFANRTPEKAEKLASRYEGRTVDFASLPGAMAATDVAVAAVAAPEPVVTRSVLEQAMEHRKRGPLLILDFGVPRNVVPEAGSLENVFLYVVDDLEELMNLNLGRRREELPAVESIVHEEADRFLEWMVSLQTAPVVVAMRQEADRLRRQTLERFGKSLPADQRELLERFSTGLVNKLLHRPTVSVRDCDPQTQEGLRRLDWTRRLFGLDSDALANGDLREDRE